MSPSKKVNKPIPKRSGPKGSKVETSKGSKVKKPEKKLSSSPRARTSSRKKKPTVDSQPSNLQIFEPVNSQTPKPSRFGTNLLRGLALLVVIGITIYIYSIRERVEEFSAYGYPGVFLVTLLANATVIIPAPGVAVVFAMGGILNPAFVALAGGAGGAIGEITGYLTGFSGQAIVENTKTYDRITPWIQKYGAWVILVLSAFPNPFFDLAGIAAGVAKIPPWKFLLCCWIGQTIKMGLFAYAGAYSIDWIASFYD